MRRKPYLGTIRNEIQSSLAYRGHFMFSLAGTVIYLVIAYFLWKAIFAASTGGNIRGVGFARAGLAEKDLRCGSLGLRDRKSGKIKTDKLTKKE